MVYELILSICSFVGGDGSVGRIGTYNGDSARGRDCAHRPGGLSESVPEHDGQDLCVKERNKNQLPGAIEGEERWRWGCGCMNLRCE